MNNDMFNKEITDVTLRGKDIRRVKTHYDCETSIFTSDKEYRLLDEEAEIYNSLTNYRESRKDSDDKAKFPSIKLMGQVRYRDLKRTKFVVLEESEGDVNMQCDKYDNQENFIRLLRELYNDNYWLCTKFMEGINNNISDVIFISGEKWRQVDVFKDKEKAVNFLCKKLSEQEVKNIFWFPGKSSKPSNAVGQWPPKCNCGRNANPHVAVGENTDPFNVKPW